MLLLARRISSSLICELFFVVVSSSLEMIVSKAVTYKGYFESAAAGIIFFLTKGPENFLISRTSKLKGWTVSI